MYKDPIVQKYLDLIEDNRSDIKKFFNGIVTKVAASECPCIMIGIENVEVGDFSNVEDEHEVNLILTLVTDIRKNFADTVRIDSGISKVVEMLTGRGDDYKLETKSILNILRNNVNIDTTNNLRTDIGTITAVTPNEVAIGRIPEYWSTEGTIKFKAHFFQER
ncbi:hypothetical protein KAU51_04285 [Candidatus Parcubacteria bacterium]|nr:hypothetical protein [Candidatus Parcubacteria bacterium]